MGIFNKNGRHYRKPALWKRIIKWTLLSILIIILSVGLAGFIFVYRTLGKIGLNTEVIYEARQQLDIPLPDEPVNILLMGTDEDPDGDSTRSDSIMLVRVNPQGECLSMLSIPRDLLVDIPGVGQDKINAAYAIGGVPLSIETIRELTGLPIHHFVLLNYEGFRKAVDAMGGVYADVDRRYFNDNSDAPWGEAYEPIDIYPGYQKLNGDDALAYVRYRHTDSDFVRIKRQQYFIRDVKAQSLKWGNFTKIPELADVFASNTTSDIGRSEVLSLTKFILSVDRDRIYQAQAPIQEAGGGSYLVLSKEQLPEVIAAFQSPEFNRPEPEPEPQTAPAGPAEETKKTAIEVLNGNGVEGAASSAASMLTDKGCLSVSVGGNAAGSYARTQVFYTEGSQGAAEDLARLFAPCDIGPMPAGTDTQAQLLLVLGDSYQAQPAPADSGNHPGVHFEADSDAGELRWKAADLQLPFTVQKPGDFPVEFDYVDFHPYEIDTDDGPQPALKVVAQNEEGDYWGIMETTFKDAPLLEAPSVEREIDGRTYRFFYADDTLRYLAWEDGDQVFWITNSLQDSLSEDTMLRLAVSFRPAQ
jgi:LCP family protein required for cell wall assembly